MSRGFSLPAWKGVAIKEPRVVMRAIIGILLAANLVAAVIAFKPFGGSGDDLRRDRDLLRSRLAQAQARLVGTKRLTDKVQLARTEGDQFLGKYVMDSRSASQETLAELFDMSKAAGIKMGAQQFSFQAIEGSDTLEMLSISAGYEGSYAQLTKLVNLIDKSPRFLIVDNMQANAPAQQAGNVINVTLRVLAFVKQTGAPS